jgi:hypothetical protein
MWWWRRVRHSVIPDQIRDEFERYGENIIALVLALPLVPDESTPQSPLSLSLHDLVYHHRNEAIAWLTERRDIEERHEHRIETVEWAILIFVILGVITDIMLLLSTAK